MNWKYTILNFLGIFFLVLGLIAVSTSIYRGATFQILYACYAGMIFIGIGILTRKSFLILSQIYILAIPLIIWSIDFFYWLIFGSPLLGVTDYFFLGNLTALDKFVSLQHLYTIPLSIYAVKLIGPDEKNAWRMSLAQLIVMFFIVSLFSMRESNINCVFYSCINIDFGLPYRIVWFAISFGMVWISSFLLNKFLWKKKVSRQS